MAHTLIKPTVVASRAVAVLYNTMVLAGLVSRDFDSDFDGHVGDTVNVRTPATFAAKTFDESVGIELQDATETSFAIVLDTILDVSFAIGAKDKTLNIENFDQQFITPAMTAIAQEVDGRIAEGLVDTAEGSGGGGTVTQTYNATTKPGNVYRNARVKLGRAKLPLTERYAVLSPEAVGIVTTDDLLVKANESGTTDALRNANIGRVFGIDNFESQVFGLGAGDRGQADGIAFHRSTYVLATRTLETPDGIAASQVSVQSMGGVGIRVISEYDVNKKRDIVSLDTLMGVKEVPSRKAGIIQLDFGQGS